MLKNYSAWDLKISDYWRQQTLHDKLVFLLRFAILAPSTHNTQPWQFVIRDNQIIVLPHKAHSLPQGDKENRLMHISLGTVVENVQIAGDYYNWDTHVSYFSNNSDGVTITFQEGQKQSQENSPTHHLIFSIQKRRTNRSNYGLYLLPSTFLDQLSSLQYENLTFHLLSDTEKKIQLADATIGALKETMENALFRKELAGYMRPNDTDAGRGMPGFVMGFPHLLSVLAPKIMPFINIGKKKAKDDEVLLKKHTPYFGIITSKTNETNDWVKAGQLYQRIALMAENEDSATHIMTAATEIDSYRTK